MNAHNFLILTKFSVNIRQFLLYAIKLLYIINFTISFQKKVISKIKFMHIFMGGNKFKTLLKTINIYKKNIQHLVFAGIPFRVQYYRTHVQHWTNKMFYGFNKKYSK